MSVTMLCPECRSPMSATESVPTTCSHCGSALPPALVATAEDQLRREPEAKPYLLRFLSVFLGIWAVVAVPLSVIFLLSSGGTYTINDVQVTREEFMRRAGLMFVAFPALGLLAGVTAWGLYRGNRWARPFTITLLLGALAKISRS